MRSIGTVALVSVFQLGLITSFSGLSSGSDTCSSVQNQKKLRNINRRLCLQCCSIRNKIDINGNNLTEISSCNRAHFNPSVYVEVANATENSNVSVPIEWVQTDLVCKDYVEQSEFKILLDGRIIAQISKKEYEAPLWIDITHTTHCFRCEKKGVSCDSILVCRAFLNQEIEQIQVLLSKFRNELLASGGQVSGWLALFSALVLGLTILTYALLWKDQNVHGWTQVSFLNALFCMYFSAGLRRVIGLNKLMHLPTLSITLEGMEDLGGVAASTNLVALSFDLFITLWRPLPTHSKSFGLKRFIIATTIAWSAGFIVLALNLNYRTDFAYDNDIVDISKHIEYTTKILESFLCIQMFGMVPSWWPTILQLSLLFLNLILFIGSLVILYTKQKSLSIAMENVKRKKLIRTWIRRFVKMFLLMGLWWPMSVICILQCYPVFSHVISVWKETLATYYYLKPKRVDFQIQWHVHLTANYLVVQAIIICILLIWNRRILQTLCKKYPALHSLTSE